MHELALAQNVVQILCEEAGRHGLDRVNAFKLRVGELRAVVPELLETCLDIAGRGTVVEGARVKLETVAGEARCTSCGERFPVAELLFLCPRCDSPGGEITAGQELTLVELEGD
jgi:hydrogenase nickel incorporation protein HypA/HybF